MDSTPSQPSGLSPQPWTEAAPDRVDDGERQPSVRLRVDRLMRAERGLGASGGWRDPGVPAPGRGRILLVVSNPTTEQWLVSHLSSYETVVSESGLEALGRPDLATLDAVLLDGAGFAKTGAAGCRHLKEDPRLAEIPFVFALPNSAASSLQTCLDDGADEVVLMPCQPAELNIRLRSIIQLHRSLGALERKNFVLNEALADLCESEARLVQAEKLSMLGEMSAEIVHEINNPLNYSRTALHVLQSMAEDLEKEDREEFSEVISDILEGMDRVSHIVRDLRSFTPRGHTEMFEISLVSVVRSARRLLEDRLATLDYMEDVPGDLRVTGNENQLCQVFLNILKNGVEATEQGERSREEAEIRVWARDVGSWIELHFRDNGCGIAEPDLKQIFQPFFTRKAKGRGMGLGLSICTRILDEHRAGISVHSEVGGHTQFTIRFPRDHSCPA